MRVSLSVVPSALILMALQVARLQSKVWIRVSMDDDTQFAFRHG